MKIAHIVCQLPPTIGGLGNSAHHFARKIAEKGQDITVFTLSSKNIDFASDKNYKVKALGSLIQFKLAAVLPQLLWKLRKFDIVHLHYPFFGSNFLVSLVKLFRGKEVKFILHYHQDVNFQGIKIILEWIPRKLFLGIILRLADKVVVSSFDYIMASNINNFYQKHKEKFVEIPFGVNETFLPRENDKELLNKYSIKESDKVIMFVGGLGQNHYFKGVDDLIKSFEYLKDDNLKLLIVGDGNLRDRYKALAKELKIENRVIFAGYVDDEQLSNHYNLADILVLPSTEKNEAFGIVLIEAMAHGKPVIASDLPGVRQVVAKGNNGFLVKQNSPEDIAKKIQDLLKPDNYSYYSKNALNSVKNYYNWDIIVDKLLDIYKGC
ncbi:glycosyltransferase family 4 protein [Candidatus Falkowbacteria bacterium]|jgi:glycosyltransferase involved in cell wall biosynthesis|nr:glycosyltransferase family 4 protein [Candidatus Falkowbacteria bacterium]MBT7006873.1 glycosyltransferase family 4 protein [Candidatus Falkowbacteria bacterium]